MSFSQSVTKVLVWSWLSIKGLGYALLLMTVVQSSWEKWQPKKMWFTSSGYYLHLWQKRENIYAQEMEVHIGFEPHMVNKLEKVFDFVRVFNFVRAFDFPDPLEVLMMVFLAIVRGKESR